MNTLKKLFAVSVVMAAAAQANAAIFDISGAFTVTADIYGSPLAVPLTVNSGAYDSVLGTGGWNVSANLSGLGMGYINWNQTFTLNGTTGLGTLNAATGCTPAGIACSGIGPQFVGPITNLAGAVVAGVQNWRVDLPSFGTAYFTPTLTDTTPAVPVPAAAWLFGSGLLGLVGAARRRK